MPYDAIWRSGRHWSCWRFDVKGSSLVVSQASLVNIHLHCNERSVTKSVICELPLDLAMSLGIDVVGRFQQFLIILYSCFANVVQHMHFGVVCSSQTMIWTKPHPEQRRRTEGTWRQLRDIIWMLQTWVLYNIIRSSMLSPLYRHKESESLTPTPTLQELHQTSMCVHVCIHVSLHYLHVRCFAYNHIIIVSSQYAKKVICYDWNNEWSHAHEFITWGLHHSSSSFNDLWRVLLIQSTHQRPTRRNDRLQHPKTSGTSTRHRS